MVCGLMEVGVDPRVSKRVPLVVIRPSAVELKDWGCVYEFSACLFPRGKRAVDYVEFPDLVFALDLEHLGRYLFAFWDGRW